MNEVATLAGGCFWCLEAVFEELEGVEKSVSGYMGGKRPNPTYEQVCTGVTGHAEVVQVTFDPSRLDYRDLLRVFFTIHDPTQLNRQGNDVGTQYRSAIYYHSAAQAEAAREVIAEIEREQVYAGKVVTEVTAAETFYAAEAYHQSYFRNNPAQQYCAYVVAPKVAKFRKQYFDRIKKSG